MAEPTSNEQLFDAMVRHQIGLLRYSGSVRNKIHALLDKTERDIADQIIRRLEDHKGPATLGTRRLQLLLDYIRKARVAAWDKVDEAWLGELDELARSEPTFAAAAIRTTAAVELQFAIPSAEALRAVVRAKPFEGKVLKDWAKTARRQDLDRLSSAINIGLSQGDSNRDIARRVVGTISLRGSDGVTELTRQQVTAITRTAVNHVSNEARSAFLAENAEVFSEEVFVATLDARTTAICRSLDGKRFEIGTGPRPPLHFQCRSLRVALLDDDLIGERPAKPVTEEMLVRDYSRRNSLADVKTRAGLPRGHKAAFDQFARVRIRDLTGPIPAKTTYQQWLTRQSAEFQNDVLGRNRGLLFRKGKLTLDRFVNRAGDELTLAQLARSERAAFIKAGLNPEDFK